MRPMIIINNTTRTRGMMGSCICAKQMQFAIFFWLCPLLLVTCAFLTPPYYPDALFTNGNNINNDDAAVDTASLLLLPMAKVHLLEGKLLMKLHGQSLEQAPRRRQQTIFGDDDEEEDNVCTKVSHANATLVHSISKSTGNVVHLRADSQFPVVFCEQQQPTPEQSQQQQHHHQKAQRKLHRKLQQQQQPELQEEECAIGGQCASIYRWADAMVRHPHPRHQLASGGYVQDQVLVPVDCLCVLAWKEKFGAANEPIVLE